MSFIERVSFIPRVCFIWEVPLSFIDALGGGVSLENIFWERFTLLASCLHTDAVVMAKSVSPPPPTGPSESQLSSSVGRTRESIIIKVQTSDKHVMYNIAKVTSSTL